MMEHWDFLVDKAELSRTELRPLAPPAAVTLAPGEVLLEVERFSLTANNITYAIMGDQLGYWQFFPAPAEWGRIPVWGFARVVRSNAPDVAEGLRLYGYWPMSTHVVTRIRRSGGGYADASPHRAALAAAYNRYVEAPETARDDQLALLRPLFTTSFLLDDLLAEVAPDATTLISSASSRTALGLAAMLRQRGAKAVGLTSPANLAFTIETGLYDAVTTYDDLGRLDRAGPLAFIDIAGDAAVRGAVHRRFGDRLRHSAIVGATRHMVGQAAVAEPLAGPKPAFFFAPDRMARRIADWGGTVFTARIRDAMERFIDDSDWLRVERHRGAQALGEVYPTVLSGTASPSVGHIIWSAAG